LAAQRNPRQTAGSLHLPPARLLWILLTYRAAHRDRFACRKHPSAWPSAERPPDVERALRADGPRFRPVRYEFPAPTDGTDILDLHSGTRNGRGGSQTEGRAGGEEQARRYVAGAEPPISIPFVVPNDIRLLITKVRLFRMDLPRIAERGRQRILEASEALAGGTGKGTVG
jgi:hypothetical protein